MSTDNSCGLDEFGCDFDGEDTRCIAKSWQCDGHPDCDDKSDENECTVFGSNCLFHHTFVHSSLPNHFIFYMYTVQL